MFRLLFCPTQAGHTCKMSYIFWQRCTQGESTPRALKIERFCPLSWCLRVMGGQGCCILAEPQGTQQLVDQYRLTWTFRLAQISFHCVDHLCNIYLPGEGGQNVHEPASPHRTIQKWASAKIQITVMFWDLFQKRFRNCRTEQTTLVNKFKEQNRWLVKIVYGALDSCKCCSPPC